MPPPKPDFSQPIFLGSTPKNQLRQRGGTKGAEEMKLPAASSVTRKATFCKIQKTSKTRKKRKVLRINPSIFSPIHVKNLFPFSVPEKISIKSGKPRKMIPIISPACSAEKTCKKTKKRPTKIKAMKPPKKIPKLPKNI